MRVEPGAFSRIVTDYFIGGERWPVCLGLLGMTTAPTPVVLSSAIHGSFEHQRPTL